jgi:hypothetical protein
MRLISVYLVPAAIALFSVLALVLWENHYVASGDQSVPLRILVQNGAPLTPEAALRQLASVEPTDHYDSRLSEAPVWFSFGTHGVPGDADVVEFPSPHMVSIACWDPFSLQQLGQARRSGAQGALSAVKAGFALRLWNTPTDVLCRASFVGPARLSAVQWPAEQMTLSTQQFHRKSGLLEGGMIVLALFILITAAINRQLLYVHFAGWLILNLRVGALSAGWDVQWLGQALPEEWLAPVRMLTIALCAVSTVALYRTLFGEYLARTRFALPLRVMQVLCLPLLACALVLPYRSFLPVMWVIAGTGLLVMTTGLVNVIVRGQGRVALWFAASFVVTFLSIFAEVISAAFNVRELTGVINSVTAALASSLPRRPSWNTLTKPCRLGSSRSICTATSCRPTRPCAPCWAARRSNPGAPAGSSSSKRACCRDCRSWCTGSRTPSSNSKAATALAASWCAPRWHMAASRAYSKTSPKRPRPPSSCASWPTMTR